MAISERITVRLDKETVSLLDRLSEEDEYRNVSDVVRNAIEFFLESKFPPGHIQKVTVDVPKTSMSDLENLVMEGDSVSVDDAIRNAVREYLRKRKDE